MGEVAALLAHWETFYVIIGASAATLTGLQFVVVTLGAQMRRGNLEANRAFGTPTIVHFCAVLYIAAVLSAPWESLAGPADLLGLSGLAALVYAAIVFRIVRRQTSYAPVLEDWVWHFTLPPIAYAVILGSALSLQRFPTVSLFVIASTAMLLLFIGIHNAWDSATYIALQQLQPDQAQQEE